MHIIVNWIKVIWFNRIVNMWLDYSRMHDDSSFSVTSQGSLPWLQSRTTTTIYTKRDTPILTLYFKQICKVWFYFNTPLHTKLWWLQFCWYYSTELWAQNWYHNTIISCKTYLKTQYNILVHRALYSAQWVIKCHSAVLS